MKKSGAFGWILITAFFLGPGPVLAQDTYSSSMAKAKQAYGEKNYDLARAFYQTAIDLDPGHAAAYQGLGNCLFYKGDKMEALRAFESSLKLEPDNPALEKFTQALRAQLGLPPEVEEPPAVAQPQADSFVREERAPIERKSPVLAGALSWLLPGAGQYYNGREEDINKGVLIDVGVLGGLGLVYVGWAENNSVTGQGVPYTLAGAGLIVASQIFGIVDAIVSADDINQKGGGRGKLGLSDRAPRVADPGISGEAGSDSFQWDLSVGPIFDSNPGYTTGFGGGLAGGFPLGGGFYLGASTAYRIYGAGPDVSVTSLDLLVSAKYRFPGKNVRPFLRAGVGSSINFFSFPAFDFSLEEAYTLLEWAAGVEFPVSQNVAFFIQAKMELLTVSGANPYYPLEFGLSLGGN